MKFEEYNPPAFQAYANDWLSSKTANTTSLEFQGAFWRLLCFQWEMPGCVLNDDAAELAQLSGLNGKFSEYEAKVKQCFVLLPDQPGKRANLRLLKLKREMYETHLAKSLAGKNGGKKSGKSRSKGAKQSHDSASSKNEANTNPSSSSSTSSITNNAKALLVTVTEVRPHVFLSTDQIAKLRLTFSERELQYWFDELTSAAQQNVKAWKKKYSNHSLLIHNWRKRRLESGRVWDESKAGYHFPPRPGTNTPKSSTERQMEAGFNVVQSLRERGE